MNPVRRHLPLWLTALLVLGCGCGFAQGDSDSDGDGFSDREENFLGTNPNDASSRPGANVNETLATNLIFVALNGSDNNPGTSNQPFRTLQKAMTIAQGKSTLGVGSAIMVGPGSYRESLTLMPAGGVLHAPIVLEAATGGTATISGADAWTNGWSLAAGSTTVYQHAWTNNWGLSPVPNGWPGLSNITRRTEIVLVNGNQYTQVESRTAMTNGTYFVDDANQLLNVQHRAGVVENDAFYEVSQRRSLLAVNEYNSGNYMSNLVVRGIHFQAAASLVEGAAVRMINCQNVSFEHCSFEFNNWTGVYIGASSNVTFKSVTANQNGAKGLEQYQVKNTVYDGVQTCFNNWRGAWGQFYGWALAGSKLLHIHQALFRDYTSYRNNTRGMWFDSDCATMLLERCVFNGNLVASGGFGLFIEANQGPIRLENCIIAHNEGDWGLLANSSENVTVSNCVLFANGTGTGGQLGSSWNTSPRTTPDFETGVTHTNQLRLWTITNSVFAGLQTTQQCVHLVNNLTSFLTTLTADHNFWHNSATPNIYKVVSTSYDLAGWQGLTGQDAHSSFLSLLVTNPAVQDAHINLLAPTNNFGTATNAVCDTQANGTGMRDILLLKFDLSSLTNIPREAELQLASGSTLNGPVAFHVYRLKTAWNESTTAAQASLGTPWAAGMFGDADYDPQPRGTGQTRNTSGLNTIVDITTLVQEWVSGASPNYGMAIIAQPIWDQPVTDAANSNQKQFNVATRESSTPSLRPQITSIAGSGAGMAGGTITLSPGALPGGSVGVPYNQTILASGAAGPYTFSLTNGALPGGLTLGAATGILSGTPTNAGSTTFTMLVTNTNGASGSQSYTLVTCNGAITLAPSTLSAGTAGTAYYQTITATGGAGPYMFTKSAGTLPPGLGLSATGLLTGTLPAGNYNFTVLATDINGCSGSQPYSVAVTCQAINVSISGIPSAAFCAGTTIQLMANASGGLGASSYDWKKDGTAFATTQSISDTPSAGNHAYVVTVTDGNGCQSPPAQAQVTVNPSPTITSLTKTDVGCNSTSNGAVTVTFSNGTAPYQANIDGGPFTTVTSPCTFTGLMAGGHTVIIQDVGGCTASGTDFIVTVSGGSSASLDFAVSTDFTANFKSSGGAFAWNAAGGVGSPAGGGVLPPSSEGTTLYTATGWNLSSTGRTMTVSTLFKAASGASYPQINLGISATTNGQFVSASTGSWLSFYLSDQSGLAASVLGYNYKNGATTSTNYPLASGITLVNGHWYQWTATFNNTSGAGTGAGSMTLTDYGTSGTNAGATLVSTSTSFGGTVLDVFQSSAAAVYPGLRGRVSGPMAAFDNWSVSASCPAITVTPPTLAGATIGSPYNQTLSAAGGVGSYSFSVNNGALPDGLTLDTATGVISGTPTNSGSATFTVQATDAYCCSGNQDYTVLISVANGIPASWLIQYFGHPTGQTNDHSFPQDDPDGDGMDNLKEYLTGSDPTNGASFFHITSLIRQGSDINITWQTAGGHTNVVQASADVSGSYSNVSPNIVLPGSGTVTTNYLHAGGATNPAAGYYRVKLVP